MSQTQICALPHRTVIQVSGPDWASFLKGLCTAPIDNLIHVFQDATTRESAAQNTALKLGYGAFLRPQGKMYADCLLLPVAADVIWLDVAANARDELLAKLNMYRLRAKVTIEALDLPVHVAFAGPVPEGFTPDARADIIGAPIAFAYAPYETTCDLETWRAFRFRHGLADAGADFAKDELYAIDANLDLLGAIDFHKGCYVGQELTSRMKRRGQIKNRILPLTHVDALTSGAEILHGERKVGEVLASTHDASLALLRLDRLAGDLTCDSVPVGLSIPDWLRPQIEV